MERGGPKGCHSFSRSKCICICVLLSSSLILVFYSLPSLTSSSCQSPSISPTQICLLLLIIMTFSFFSSSTASIRKIDNNSDQQQDEAGAEGIETREEGTVHERYLVENETESHIKLINETHPGMSIYLLYIHTTSIYTHIHIPLCMYIYTIQMHS